MKRKVFATITGFSLLLSLAGCSPVSAPTEEPSSSSDSSQTPELSTEVDEETSTDATEGTSTGMGAAPAIDRTTSPWNNDVPAEFPLEEVPMPANGTFDYAELVEEDVWNVMISDIPNADHEAWVAAMNSQFKNMDEDSICYIGKGKAAPCMMCRRPYLTKPTPR